MTKEKIVIIDAHALIHRAYHALPVLTSPRGEQVNAVYGFASILIRVLKELKPEYAVAAFDMAGPTFRHAEFAEYKAHRPEAEAELIKQFPLTREIAAALGIPVLEKQGYEADDIIATVVENLKSKKNLEKIIVTGDMDTLQLLSDKTVSVYTLKKGVTETAIYDEKTVRERFDGLGPEQMTDFKGLKGDPSDNIPGVPGIGEKTAIALLKEYGSLENLYKNINKLKAKSLKLFEKLLQYKNQAFFSQKLATLDRRAPIDFSLKESVVDLANQDSLKPVLMRFGFKSLVGRLAAKDKPVPESVSPAVQGELIGDELEEYFKKGVFSEKIYELEKNLRPVLRKMEQAGILLDANILKSLGGRVAKELAQVKKEVVKLAGEDFNLNSTRELGRIVFEKLNLGGRRIKKTKTGAYSTSFEELEKMKAGHPIVPLMLRWRELSKLKSTYIDTLPELVGADGRLHTTYKQLGAVTGRLASENPNLQNIPTKGEYGPEIRRAFTAEKGWLIVSADYSQIELRVAAALSGDQKMIDTFLRGEDIHTRTAAEVFNVPLEKVTKDMRRDAKTLNFGVLYGMGARAFAQSAGVSQSEAQRFVEEYKHDFSELAVFMEKQKVKAKTLGFVETMWGRKRYLDDLRSPNPMWRAAAERMAINMPIQGTAADIIKAAMVEFDKKVGRADDIRLLLQVHDELVFEVKKETLAKYAPLIKSVMENVVALAVPIEVEVEAGPNWGELSPFDT